eukprot:11216492-Lingulodinium_polyedra.AAC.1
MTFIPQNSAFKQSIYKDTKNNRWQAWHEISGTASRSWTVHGELDAMMKAIKWLWKQAMELEDVQCPYAFLND